MAEELRWESLVVASGTSSVNSGAEFRNDSSVNIHIREINYAHILTTGANDEFATVEVSKSPTITTGTSNTPWFSYGQRVGITAGTTGSGADDVAQGINGGRKYAKGQLVLEPGESLFVNTQIGAGAPTLQPLYQLGYHF